MSRREELLPVSSFTWPVTGSYADVAGMGSSGINSLTIGSVCIMIDIVLGFSSPIMIGVVFVLHSAVGFLR